ncbi:MAG: hypothetical protein ABI175_17945, partial [Polyangiales bacterium]
LALLPVPPRDLDARLAALEAEYAHDKQAVVYSGIVLAELGRWRDARARLEAVRGTPNIWDSQADLAELDAWLGLARAKDGDREGARRAFEESLRVISIWRNGIDGLSYMHPRVELALAPIVWDAGDRVRARYLAGLAITGARRLGPFHDAERVEAEAWLAAHPL